MKNLRTTVSIDYQYPLISDKIAAFKEKTYLDKSFNRDACWDALQESKYMTSLLIGQAPSKIIVCNIAECLELVIEDTLDYEYFNKLLMAGFDRVAIDGNNRTITIYKYLLGQVAIQNGQYDLPTGPVVITNNNNTFKTHPKALREHILENVKITVCEYVVATREDLSRLFININDGFTLNDQERRNAILVPYAQWIREMSEKHAKAFKFIFRKDNYRLKFDEQIVNLSVCSTYGPEHGISKKDKFEAYSDNSTVWNHIVKKGGQKNISDTLNLVEKYADRGFKDTSTLMNLFMLICYMNKNKIKILDEKAFFKWFMSTENRRVGNIDRKIITLQNGTELNYISTGAATSAAFLPARLKIILEDFSKINKGIITEIDPERLFSATQRYSAWTKQSGVCPRTGKIIPEDEIQNHEKWAADHVLPHSLGGTTTIDNLELVCRKYNLSKGNKVIPDTIAA